MYQSGTFDNLPLPATPAPELPADPRPLVLPGRAWLPWASLGISLAVIAGLLVQMRSISLEQIRALLPLAPAFWVAFLAFYFAPVAFEWLIFRRLWRIPPAGVWALTRKHVGNEIVLGYIGEAYFYVWARQRSHLTGAPFGAVKDVAILSAMVGNAVTLVAMAGAYPLLRAIEPGASARLVYLSVLVILLSSLAAAFFRRRLFSLPSAELRQIAALHLLRILAITGLSALMWHLVLPAVALSWWLLLAALRLLLSRLPLLPNKDIAFAELAILAIGHDSEVVAMLAMLGTLIVATHVVVGLAVTAPEILRRRVKQ